MAIQVDAGNTDPFDTYTLGAAGPLMNSAIALFGNESFFYEANINNQSGTNSAMVNICQSGKLPFSQYHLSALQDEVMQQYRGVMWQNGNQTKYYYVMNLVGRYAAMFNETDVAQNAFSAAMFLANQVVLTRVAEPNSWTPRMIYTSPGLVVPRPVKSHATTIGISVLIGMQLLGILCLVWYIYQVPTSTSAYNALAMTQIGAMIGAENVPRIGAGSENMTQLRRRDGLVGVADNGGYKGESSAVELLLGAPGLITRKPIFDSSRKR